MLSKFHFSRHALGPLSPAADVGIATSTNEAYEMMKQGGQGGGQDGGDRYKPPGGPPVGEGMYEVPSPPAPQQPAAVSGGGGTEGEGDVVYELIPGEQ